jgi:integrase/recombinase XerD
MQMQNRRKSRRIPTVLNEEEQVALLYELRHNGPMRNYLMTAFMLNYGLRVSEVLNLSAQAVDWTTGFTIINGKGNKDRGLWLSDRDLLDLKNFRTTFPTEKYLFRSRKGEVMTARYINYMLKAAAERAGIKKNVHAHCLRHSFASDFLRETKNLVLLSKTLGHADLDTTVIYCHIVDDEMEYALKNLRKERL